jgi:hypothetical protein
VNFDATDQLTDQIVLHSSDTTKQKQKLHDLSSRANYTDRATAACRRRDCQLFFSDTGEKNGNTMRAHQLFIDFKKAYDSVRREVFYSTLLKYDVPMKLVRLIKMC